MNFLTTIENLPKIITIGAIILIVFGIIIARLLVDNHDMSKEIDEMKNEISQIKRKKD